MDIAPLSSADQSRMVGAIFLLAFGVAFFLVMSIYSSWYLLDCLYGDRKDRSILFWKSLPVSDTVTVLAKLFTGLIAIPVVYFIAADVSTLLMAFIVSVRLRAVIGGALWQPHWWLQMQVLWVYLIVTSAIWYLPFAGWFVLVSAWARRAVMLWSILPLLAVFLLERWFFGTDVFGSALVDRALGYPAHAFRDSDHNSWMSAVVGGDTWTMPGDIWHLLNPLYFLSSPATWLGAVVGAALVVGAVQMRLRRTEM